MSRQCSFFFRHAAVTTSLAAAAAAAAAVRRRVIRDAAKTSPRDQLEQRRGCLSEVQLRGCPHTKLLSTAAQGRSASDPLSAWCQCNRLCGPRAAQRCLSRTREERLPNPPPALGPILPFGQLLLFARQPGPSCSQLLLAELTRKLGRAVVWVTPCAHRSHSNANTHGAHQTQPMHASDACCIAHRCAFLQVLPPCTPPRESLATSSRCVHDRRR